MAARRAGFRTWQAPVTRSAGSVTSGAFLYRRPLRYICSQPSQLWDPPGLGRGPTPDTRLSQAPDPDGQGAI